MSTINQQADAENAKGQIFASTINLNKSAKSATGPPVTINIQKYVKNAKGLNFVSTTSKKINANYATRPCVIFG